MLKVIFHNEMETLNDRAQNPEVQWIWARKYKDERKRSGLDHVVVE